MVSTLIFEDKGVHFNDLKSLMANKSSHNANENSLLKVPFLNQCNYKQVSTKLLLT